MVEEEDAIREKTTKYLRGKLRTMGEKVNESGGDYIC